MKKYYFLTVPLFFIIFLIYFYSNEIAKFLFLNLNLNSSAVRLLEMRNKNDFESNFLLGRIYFIDNKLDKSLEHYNKAIELDNTSMQAYYGRGLTYGFMNFIFLDFAKKDFEKYIELGLIEEKSGRQVYGLWAGYNDLAWVHFLLGEFKESEAVAKKGLEISPNNPWLLNMLGTSLIEQNKCEEALPHLGLAKFYAEKITIGQFGEAYSGDDKKWWPKGRGSMISTIEENIKICRNFSTPENNLK